VHSPAIPSVAGALDFLETQCLFHALFPPLNHKPIKELTASSTPGSRTKDAAETAIQACLSECRMFVFQSVLHLDYIGHHNFASSDHLQMTVNTFVN
jgi:hypothetical protein